MSTKHTKGPWALSENEGDGKRYVVAQSERHGQSRGIVLVAQIKAHRSGSADRVCPDNVQDANAHLIAAAPDLLAALERAEALFRIAIPQFDWGKSALSAEAISLLNEVPGETRAAIAKATGAP